MSKIFWLLMISILFLSCVRKHDRKPIIISENAREFKRQKKNDKEITRYVPTGFYKQYNLILTGNNRVYYFHRKYRTMFCSTSEFDFSNPEFLRLLPSELNQIPQDSLKILLEKIYLDNTDGRRLKLISVASEVDTIRNQGIYTIIDFSKSHFKGKVPYFLYTLRLLTEEESVVLHAKLENIPYNPIKVKWKNKFGGFKPIELKNKTRHI